MNFSSYKKAEIIWVDDTFGKKDEFVDGYDFWGEMFGVPEKIYRLLDLKLVMIATYDEAKAYIENIQNNLTTYYFFIVDLNLPKDYKGLQEKKFASTRGKKLGELLLKKRIHFAFLSSAGSIGDISAQQKDLRLVDFYMKEKHSRLKLPAPLKHKLLNNLQMNVNWIDLEAKIFSNISHNSQNIKNDNSEAFRLFPYFDKYKDFINIVEFNNATLDSAVFLKSSHHNSLEFEKQCSLLVLSDMILSNEEVEIQFVDINGNLQEDITYQTNKLDSLLHDKVDNEVIWIVKLYKIENDIFHKITQRLHGKKALFIVSDDEYENYLETYELPYSLLEIPSFRSSEIEQKQNLFKHLLNIKVTQVTLNEGNQNIYTDFPELVFDVNTYIALTDPSFEIEKLSDSYEISTIVFNLFNQLNHQSKELMQTNEILPYDELLGISLDKFMSEDNIEKVKEKSLLYWLKHSWNFPYSVPIEKYFHTEEEQEAWELNSIQILKHLLRDFKASENSIYENLQNIFKNELIESMLNGTKVIENKKLKDVSTSIKWPHRQFPMPSILHKKFEEINKHLWFQHNHYDFINYSKDLSCLQGQLDMNLDFYDNTITFINQSYKHLPKKSHTLIKMIINDIATKKLSVDNAEFKEAFVQYSNTILRISQIFLEIVKSKDLKIDKVKFFDQLNNLGNLGTRVGKIRGEFQKHLYFKVKDNSICCYKNEHIIDELNKALYYQSFDELIENRNNKQLIEYTEQVNENKSFNFSFYNLLSNLNTNITTTDIMNLIIQNQIVMKDNGYFDLVDSNKSIYSEYSDSVFISQLSSQFLKETAKVNVLKNFNLPFKVIKYMNTIIHNSFMADSRNKAMVHDLREINLDLLYESFIFSYESIWLQYQYIINSIEKDYFTDLTTNYVELTCEAKHIIDPNFKTKEDFDNKLDELLSTKKENNLVKK